MKKAMSLKDLAKEAALWENLKKAAPAGSACRK